jgi:hypothetical protein
MIESVLKRWPEKTRLLVDFEGPCPGGLLMDRRVYYLTRHPERDAWIQQYRDYPGQDQLRRCAWRFAFCSFAVTGWGLKSDADVMVWLDADTYTHRDLPMSELEAWLDGKALAYLGRKGRKAYSETGFVMYNLKIPAVREMLGDWRECYLTAKIFELEEWHDSYIFDVMRRRHFDKEEVTDLTPWGRGYDHVFLNGPTGAYMDHMKGRRKADRSSPRDLLPQATSWARNWVNNLQ